MIYTTLHSDLEKSSCSKTNTEFPNSVETEVLIIKLVLENTYYTQASLFFKMHIIYGHQTCILHAQHGKLDEQN